ncbi:MAG: DUF72 domain-containing protein [Bacteroidota bacterium]|nr:DUF72 domain-containing protein [Bacteroidota bacterium]
MTKYYIGTAGWSYKDWVPNFYPKGQSKNFDWLQFYSRHFNVVEVNATYYAYLSPNSFKGWVEKVSSEEEFLFTVKLHQDFTHTRRFEEANIKAVRTNLDILAKAERLGGLLIQFPYSYAFNSPAAEYLRNLNDIFQDYNRFVELRHSSWNNPDAYDFFRELDISLCTIDQPQIGRSISFEPLITNSRAYFRFHGRNEAEWKKSISNYGKEQTYEQASERYKYLYSPGELVEIEQKIKQVEGKVKEVFVIMNNHPSSYGIVNAFELLFMLRRKDKLNIPESTLKAFPRLSKIAAA